MFSDKAESILANLWPSVLQWKGQQQCLYRNQDPVSHSLQTLLCKQLHIQIIFFYCLHLPIKWNILQNDRMVALEENSYYMKLVTTTFVDFLNDAEIIIIFGCTACYLDPFIRPISPEPDKPHQNNNDDTRRTAIKIKGHWFECSIVLLNI